jgi:hypothetical protein
MNSTLVKFDDHAFGQVPYGKIWVCDEWYSVDKNFCLSFMGSPSSINIQKYPEEL